MSADGNTFHDRTELHDGALIKVMMETTNKQGVHKKMKVLGKPNCTLLLTHSARDY